MAGPEREEEGDKDRWWETTDMICIGHPVIQSHLNLLRRKLVLMVCCLSVCVCVCVCAYVRACTYMCVCVP